MINKKRVYRLCKGMGILLPQRRRRRRTLRHTSCNREVVAVNQVWESDIKYGYIAGERRFFFVQAILDVADRMVVDYHIGLTCTADQATQTLRGALERRKGEFVQSRPVIRTDNGPQFTSGAWLKACDEYGREYERISGTFGALNITVYRDGVTAFTPRSREPLRDRLQWGFRDMWRLLRRIGLSIRQQERSLSDIRITPPRAPEPAPRVPRPTACPQTPEACCAGPTGGRGPRGCPGAGGAPVIGFAPCPQVVSAATVFWRLSRAVGCAYGSNSGIGPKASGLRARARMSMASR